MRIDDSNFETFDKVQKRCGYNYDIIWTDSHNLKGYVDPYTMLNMMDDLLCEMGRIEEKQEDIDDLKREIEHYKSELEYEKRDKEDNYVPRRMSDYTGDSYDDMF